MFEFFLKDDIAQTPQVTKGIQKGWILNEIGLCLMNLGRLRDAVLFNKKGAELAQTENNFGNASMSYQNLVELHAHPARWRQAPKLPVRRLTLPAKRRTSKAYLIHQCCWLELCS